MDKCTHYSTNWNVWYTIKHTRETNCNAIAEHIAALEQWISRLTGPHDGSVLWNPDAALTKSKVESMRQTLAHLKSELVRIKYERGTKLAQWQFYNVLEKARPEKIDRFLRTFLESRDLSFPDDVDWTSESDRLSKSIFIRDQDAARAISMAQIYII